MKRRLLFKASSMSLRKRLKNLWDLSGMEIAMPIIRNGPVKDRVLLGELFKGKKLATIIEPNTYADDIPTETKDI